MLRMIAKICEKPIKIEAGTTRSICVGSAFGRIAKSAKPIAPQDKDNASSLGVLVGDMLREAK